MKAEALIGQVFQSQAAQIGIDGLKRQASPYRRIWWTERQVLSHY